MTPEQLAAFLGWATLLNIAFLAYWSFMLLCCRNWIRKVHGRWVSLSEERFDEIHYQCMAIYKIGIFLFNLMPYLALRIIL